MGSRRVIKYHDRDKELWEAKMKSGLLAAARGGRPVARRAGVGAGRQDRHSERSVRRLCRLRRQMVGRGRQDGDRGFRRQRARPEDRDRHRRPSEQARSRHQHRAALVRGRRRRHDHRADDVVGRARGAGPVEGKEEDRHRRRRRDLAPDRRRLHALWLPLGLRYPCARGRHRRRAGRRRAATPGSS